MKRLLFFLIVVVGFFPYDSYSQRLEDLNLVSADINSVMSGRAAGEKATMLIARANKTSTFPIYFEENRSLGNGYEYSIYINGQKYYSQNFHFSDPIIPRVENHFLMPKTGSSLNQICGSQASAIARVTEMLANIEKAQLEQMKGQLKDDCNCPDPDLRRNFDNQVDDFPIKGLGDDGRYLIMSDQQARMALPNFDELVKTKQIKKTWLGRNWGWIVPIAAVAIGVGIAYAKGAFTKTKTTYVPYDDPNNPHYDPNHNPNQRLFFDPGEIFQQIKNIALPEFTQQQQQPLMVAIPL